MFLTPSRMPLCMLFISTLTFCVLRSNDPVDLSRYQDKMYGLPLPLVCLSPLLPFCVWACYEALILMGPKGSSATLKVYD